MSLLEQCETIDAPTLEKVVKVLGDAEETIKNFKEETAINNIQNNYEGSNNTGANVGAQYTFNPIDKIVELYEA